MTLLKHLWVKFKKPGLGLLLTIVTIKVIDTISKTLAIKELDRLNNSDLDVIRYKAGEYLFHIRNNRLQSIARVIEN